MRGRPITPPALPRTSIQVISSGPRSLEKLPLGIQGLGRRAHITTWLDLGNLRAGNTSCDGGIESGLCGKELPSGELLVASTILV